MKSLEIWTNDPHWALHTFISSYTFLSVTGHWNPKFQGCLFIEVILDEYPWEVTKCCVLYSLKYCLQLIMKYVLQLGSYTTYINNILNLNLAWKLLLIQRHYFSFILINSTSVCWDHGNCKYTFQPAALQSYAGAYFQYVGSQVFLASFVLLIKINYIITWLC